MQLDVRLADRDARWHCERFFTLTLAGGQVDMFFIDTSPGVASYQSAPWAANPGVLPCIMQTYLILSIMRNESTVQSCLQSISKMICCIWCGPLL